MKRCALCSVEVRVEVPYGDTLCAHHVGEDRDRWAENNRCMCDLLHRGRVPPRLPPGEREGELGEHAEVVFAEVA